MCQTLGLSKYGFFKKYWLLKSVVLTSSHKPGIYGIMLVFYKVQHLNMQYKLTNKNKNQ